jgi:hypothetical protein
MKNISENTRLNPKHAIRYGAGSETVTEKPLKAHCRWERLPLGAIKAKGWLARQMRVEADGMGGHMDELEPDMIGNPFVTRSRKRGVQVGWCSELSATYWTGLVQLAFTLDDPELKEKAEKWVKGVLAAQEPDGYIGSYRRSDDRKQDFNAFGVAWAVRALMSFYEATGRTEVLEACRSGLLWFVTNWKKHKTWYVGSMIIESLVVVYLHTGDHRLLIWAEEYMAWLKQHPFCPNSVTALANPRLDYNSAHAVAYGIWMPLPAILSMANGRRDYLKASEQAVRKVIRKCFQRTGAPSSNNEWLSPPGATSETEYCNFATYADAFSWLARITGKPDYGDLIEKIVFNGSQGGKKKDGRAIAYMTSPNQFFATSVSSAFGNRQDMEVYAPVYPVACCPAQSVRVLPEYVRGLCLYDKSGGLVMPCYGPCRIESEPVPGVKLKIEVKTEYPFKETVQFVLTLNQPARVPIRFHVPAWCQKAGLTVNGTPIKGKLKPNSYFTMSRTWQSNDTIQLTLPMEVKVMEVNDWALSDKRPLVIERGPLLFSLPIKTEWKAIPGKPLTPLPKGWSWFEALPVKRKIPGDVPLAKLCTWNYALNRERLLRPSAIRVIERRKGSAMPWEQSPVKIRLPARRHMSAFALYTKKNMGIYSGPDGLVERDEFIELVPYGCTNLRVSYFPSF